MTIRNGRFSEKLGFLAKQSNTSVIGISASKVDSSTLYRQLDIEDCSLIKLELSDRGGRVGCHNRKSLSYNHKPGF